MIIKAVIPAAAYVISANMFYLARRSYLRQMPISKLWHIRTTREEGVSRLLHLTFILAWQGLTIFYPIIELFARILGYVSFFYSYPNAQGCGVVLEPRNVQHLRQAERAKHQIRIDWHRFDLNIGNIGRQGYRHPPAVSMNLPHIDMPKKGMKHWPWRRKENYNRVKNHTR
ncbi:unnamed protein product, partial [Heterosigma akashiwo]